MGWVWVSSKPGLACPISRDKPRALQTLDFCGLRPAAEVLCTQVLNA
jgi:hypothetical protein